MPAQFQANIKVFVSRIIQSINQPLIINEKTYHLGVSIGIAIIPKDGNSVTEILKIADTAMYRAKQQGKNRYQFFNRNIKSNIDNHLKISAGIKKALQNHEFQVHYQVQVDKDKNQFFGIEALLRWLDPESRKLLPANEFLNIATDTNNMHLIDEWVIKQVTEDMAQINAVVAKMPYVSINISASKLGDISLAQRLETQIKRHFIAAHCLQIEVTEASLLYDWDKSVDSLRALKELGIRLCVDNYGSGYSSMPELHHLRFDQLKIDRSLTQHLATNNNDLKMCRSIIQTAKNLNIECMAEGIESDAQIKILHHEGCHLMQGYVFAHPKPLHKLITFFQKSMAS